MYIDNIESALELFSKCAPAQLNLFALRKNVTLLSSLLVMLQKKAPLQAENFGKHMVDAVLYFEGDRGQSIPEF